MSSIITLTLFSILSLVGRTIQASAPEPLFVLEDSTATFFYDLDAANSRCAGRGGGGDGTLSNVPNCENNGPTIGELNTNRIVALNETLLKGDMSAWCGKEVKIYQSGTEVVFDEPLVVWGTCGACTTEAKFDLSVDAYLQLMPDGSCMSNGGNNPSDFRLEIVNNQIWEPAPGSASYSPVAASTGVYEGGGYNGPRAVNTLGPPWRDGPVVGGAGAAANMGSGSGSGSGSGVAQTQPAVGGGGYQPTNTYTQSVTSSQTYAYNLPSGTPQSGRPAHTQATAANAQSSLGAVVQPQSQPSSGGGGCIKGDTQCVGLELQMCNYITNDGTGPVWTSLYICPGGCDVSKQPCCLQ